MHDKEKASRSRLHVLAAARLLLSRAQDLVGERGPLLRGSFQLRGTRCGKDNCKCTKGELHTTAVLVVSEGGKQRSFYLRGPERPEVQRRVGRYQRFRSTRAELRKLNESVVNAADELLEALLEPHKPLRESKGARRRSKPRGRQKGRP